MRNQPPLNELTRLLRENLGEAEHRTLSELFAQPLFRHDDRLPPAGRRSLAYRRLRALQEQLGPASRQLGHRELFLRTHAWIALTDTSLFVLYTLHYSLCLGAVLERDTGDPALRRTVEALERMDTVGEFLMTELGYGNNSQSLRTQAVYHPVRREFLLSTPDPSAAKYMPPTTFHGIPKTAVVAARLVSKGDDHGVHLFLVPLSTEEGTLPGITVHELGDRPVNHADHALTLFDQVPVPLSHLLTDGTSPLLPDGSYRSSTADNHRRYLGTTTRLRFARLAVGGAAVTCSQAALLIALRHGMHRTTFAAEGREAPLLSYRTHQKPLVTALARTYAMTFLLQRANRIDRDASGQDPTAAAMANLFKGVATTWAERIVSECRQRVGAQGMFSVNRIIDYLVFTHCAITAEGDSQVLLLRSGNDVLAGLLPPPSTPSAADPGGSLLNEDRWLPLMSAREEGIRRGVQARLGRPTEGDGAFFDLWNAAGPDLLGLTEAAGARLALEQLLDAAAGADDPAVEHRLRRLAGIFMLDEVRRDAAWFAGSGLVEPGELLRLQDAVADLCDTLVESVDELVEAFGLPSTVTSSPIASFGGDYGRLLAGLSGQDTSTGAPAPRTPAAARGGAA
ncbi:acyl-CoA dehydrogenase [Streptomyces argenteolus]|uniref:Acyl-CoA dehydrogenase n=1 Tax=Streptomyces argenteolus TaxID=67274 RepID=A0ABW6XEL8_9ACTN